MPTLKKKKKIRLTSVKHFRLLYHAQHLDENRSNNDENENYEKNGPHGMLLPLLDQGGRHVASVRYVVIKGVNLLAYFSVARHLA